MDRHHPHFLFFDCLLLLTKSSLFLPCTKQNDAVGSSSSAGFDGIGICAFQAKDNIIVVMSFGHSARKGDWCLTSNGLLGVSNSDFSE